MHVETAAAGQNISQISLLQVVLQWCVLNSPAVHHFCLWIWRVVIAYSRDYRPISRRRLESSMYLCMQRKLSNEKFGWFLLRFTQCINWKKTKIRPSLAAYWLNTVLASENSSHFLWWISPLKFPREMIRLRQWKKRWVSIYFFNVTDLEATMYMWRYNLWHSMS